jgi:hypothetical protein
VVPNHTARAALGMSLGYGVLMALASASVAYDELSGTRFWLLVHPLVVAAFVSALATVNWPAAAKQLCALAWAGVALHAAFVFAREVHDQLPRAHSEQGFFAARLGTSTVIERALALHDAGECQLAANDAVTLLPHSGTRPLKIVGEHELPLFAKNAAAHPLCLVLIRDQTMHWSMEGEYERVYQAVRQIGSQIDMRQSLKDEVGELWLPRALAPTALAMP